MADKKPQAKSSIIDQVAERIRTSDNVLVALSKDPSVDELSAALGLTFIDKMGKYATAIFSGAVPNAIEFLEPEKTFETNTNSLQDFIIALDKEKADHLRYKIDGDYVKVYITPYKTTIEESDIEFSHGDYNVDLVVALNVPGAADLDSALSEYGRIMHDASSINIHADVAGNFADLEWGNPNASSVSEMIYQLSEKLREEEGQKLVDKPIATALMAGIVAATNRFSNEHTKPETLNVASKLMIAGADQQLISSSIPVDILTSDVVDANEDAKASEPKHEKKKENKETAEKVNELEALENAPSDNQEAPSEDKAPEPEPTPEPTPIPTPEPTPAPTPAPKKEKKPDPTSFEIHHGAVDFELDENGEEKIIDAEEPAADDAAASEEAAPEPAPAENPTPEAPIIPVLPADGTPANLAPINLPPANTSEAATPAPIQVPQAPAAPTPESVIVAPEVSPEEAARETHVAEPLNETDLNPEDHAAENAIDAALQKAAEAARQQAEATAQLNQMVAANTPAQNPVMTELAATGIKNITPPGQAAQAPALPKDYSAMMNEALAEPLVAEPVQSPIESAPVMAPQMPMQQPVQQMPMQQPMQQAAVPQMQMQQPMQQMQMQQPVQQIPQMAAPAEYAAQLPMPDPNGILPPPPAPFAPEASLPVASPAELPTAQAYAEQIQATNPMVQTVPTMPATAPAMPAPVLPVEAPVTPIAPAVPEEEPTLSNGLMTGQSASPAVQGVNPVMQDQIYPSDPSAFRIPGM